MSGDRTYITTFTNRDDYAGAKNAYKRAVDELNVLREEINAVFLNKKKVSEEELDSLKNRFEELTDISVGFLYKCLDTTDLVFALDPDLEIPSDISKKIAETNRICNLAMKKGEPFIRDMKIYDLKLFAAGTTFGLFLALLAMYF